MLLLALWIAGCSGETATEPGEQQAEITRGTVVTVPARSGVVGIRRRNDAIMTGLQNTYGAGQIPAAEVDRAWEFHGGGTVIDPHWILTAGHVIGRSALWDSRGKGTCVEQYSRAVTSEPGSMSVYVGGYYENRTTLAADAGMVPGFLEEHVDQAIPFPDLDRNLHSNACLPYTDVALLRVASALPSSVTPHEIYKGDTEQVVGSTCRAYSFGPAAITQDTDAAFEQTVSGTLRSTSFVVLGVSATARAQLRAGAAFVTGQRNAMTGVALWSGDSGSPCLRDERVLGLLATLHQEWNDAMTEVTTSGYYTKTETFRDWVQSVVFETGSRDATWDGKPDISLAEVATGDVIPWKVTPGAKAMDQIEVRSETWRAFVGNGWTPRGVGDFNGDHVADYLYQYLQTDGSYPYGAMMLVPRGAPSVLLRPPATSDYSVVGVADVNADDISDIIWRNRVTGKNVFWKVNPLDPSQAPEKAIVGAVFDARPDTTWEILAVADFDRFEVLSDGTAVTRSTPDILWRDANGRLELWLMDYWQGTYGRRRTVALEAPLNQRGKEWSLAAIGDYNADGHTDLLWLCDDSTAVDAQGNKLCQERRLDLWMRRSPDASQAEARPRFSFVSTCGGDLSYRGRWSLELVRGGCDAYNCVDPAVADFSQDTAGCTFPPEVLSTLYPVGPR